MVIENWNTVILKDNMAITASIIILAAAFTLSLFLSVLNYSLWRARREDHLPFWLAIWLGASTVFAFCRILQYGSMPEQMYIVVPRILLTAGYMLAWLGYEVGNAFIGYRPLRWERYLVRWLVAVPIVLLWAGNLILTDQGVVRTIAYGGQFHGVLAGRLYLPAGLLILALGLIPPIRLVKSSNSHKWVNSFMAMGFLFVIFFSLVDFIATAFSLVWIRLSDFSYLPLAVIFSYIQVERFGSLYRDLDVRVNERTSELRIANEALRAEIIERTQAEEALRQSEERFRNTLDNMLEGCQIIGFDWRYQYINHTVASQGKQTREALTGRTMMEMYPGIEHTKLFSVLSLCMRERVTRQLEDEFVFPDGSKGWFELSIRPVPEGIFILSIDITERKRAEEEIRRRADEMTALYETTHDLVIERDLSGLLLTIVERAVGLLGASGGGLYLCQPEQNQVLCLVSYNTPKDYTGTTLQYGEGAAGLVAVTGEPLIIEDYRFWEGRAAVYEQDRPFVSLLSVPMRWQDRVIGVIHVIENNRPRKFTQEELKIVTLFADQAALAIENSRLIETALRQSKEAEAIADISRDISATLQLDAVLERIAFHAKDLLHAETSAVYLSEHNTRALRAIASIGPDAGQIKDDPLQMGEGILGKIALQKYGEIVNDTNIDPRAITIKGTEVEPLEHLMGVPVLSGDQLTGLIAVWRTGLGLEFKSTELDFLGKLAGQVAVAIENARLFESTRQRLAEVEAVHTVSTALRSARTLDEALPIILDQLMDLLHAGGASLEMVDLSGSGIVTVLAHGGWAQVTGLRTPPGEGVTGWVIATGQPYVSADVVAEGVAARPDLFGELHSVACVPVIAQSQPTGALWIGRQTPILEEEIRLLAAIGEMVGNALHRMQLHERTEQLLRDLQISNLELSKAYDVTLEGWAKALELRDKETEGHSRRVTDLTLRLARCMGISEPELTHIRRGVLLHDIGKMGISDHLLKKPTTLSEDEWVEMRKHPLYAYDLLHPITYLQPALDIPYCHHERWNGTGYPRGLGGEQIPLAARIFAVVDVYDALSFDRPYREAWPPDKVLDHLCGQAGKDFDPRVVNVFISLLQEDGSGNYRPG